MNVAVHLPVGLLPTKLASRTPPQSPNSPGTMPYTISHSHVIVNTELSMFGKSLLPKTRFDNALDAAHPLPGFQPIEMVTSGRYLGEIVRLVVADGITTAQILGGQMPNVFKKPYGLDTEDLAELEESWIEHGEEGAKVVVSRWTGLDVDSIRDDDVTAIVSIVRAVTKRAQQIIAVAVYALSCVRDNAEAKRLAGLATGRHKVEEEDEMVACAGSVIQKYPGFKEGVQEVIDRMCPLDRDRQAKGALGLCIAHESSLLGAAVCAAVYAAVVRAAGDRA